MAERIEDTSIAWKQIAGMWSTYFTPPSRISPEEAERYRVWITQLKPKTALVLGATPELRDILNGIGCETTVIDINLEMIVAMNSLVAINNPEEILVRANWLSNPLRSGYFDVVVGDAVLPNIPWKDRSLLLSEIKRCLRPTAVFIPRAFYAPRKKPFTEISQLFEHFSQKEPSYRSALELVLELQFFAYDQNDHIGSFAKAKDLLLRFRVGNKFNFRSESLRQILDMVWDVWCTRFANKVFVYAYKDEEEADYNRYFEIAGTFESKDNPYSKLTPMYLLRSR